MIFGFLRSVILVDFLVVIRLLRLSELRPIREDLFFFVKTRYVMSLGWQRGSVKLALQ